MIRSNGDLAAGHPDTFHMGLVVARPVIPAEYTNELHIAFYASLKREVLLRVNGKTD